MQKAKYIQVAEALAAQIKRGDFMPGERIFSRSELAVRYEIGAITAVRVQNCLADQGLVSKVRGNGIFVNYVKDSNTAAVKENEKAQAVKRIIEFRYTHTENFPLGFAKGIEEAVAKAGIEHHIEIYNRKNISLQNINAFIIDPEAGYLVHGGGAQSLINAAIVLLNPFIHSVLLDTIIPGSNCVLTDCFDGVRQLVEFAASRKCRKVIFAENFSTHPEDLYNAERRDAAIYFSHGHSLSCEVIDNGSHKDIFEALKRDNRKTAVLFPQDDPALRFKKLLRQYKTLSPLVLGFDDSAEYEDGLEKLTTIHVDKETMGRTAVEILAEPPSPRKKIIRIPGKLMVRN